MHMTLAFALALALGPAARLVGGASVRVLEGPHVVASGGGGAGGRFRLGRSPGAATGGRAGLGGLVPYANPAIPRVVRAALPAQPPSLSVRLCRP